ncbi:MAG: LytTR family DNA-binding domain-containing protein, partial [Bacteroidota bacterium]|nr:LytTR family DNA-binding domain-containing protein [Bacteroidota bacterium]
AHLDLLFLDVEMSDGTGFELLDKIKDQHFPVIFTTAHDEFAIRAFRYNAIDYLLKPIDPDEFIEAVQKAKDHQHQSTLRKQFAQLVQTSQDKTFDRITLATSEGLIFTNTKDITRIETYGNYCFVFLATGDRLLVSKNLKEFEEMLPEPEFFRIHQSHIVNTLFVKKIIKDDGEQVIMSDGMKIPVSRRRKEEFMHAIAQQNK